MTNPPSSSGSILEVLHPDGFAGRSLVLGSAWPERLAGEAASAGAASPLDLVVIAPDGRESGDPAWIAEAVHTAAGRLARDGVAYVVVPRRRRPAARRMLRTAGLEPAGELVHLPDLGRTRHVATPDRAVLRHLIAGQLSSRRWERHAGLLAAGLPRPLLVAALASVGLVARRPGARRTMQWLADASDGAGSAGPVAISRSWHALHDGLVVQCFAGRPSRLAAVAKLKLDRAGNDDARREADLLDRLGAAARAAGADVPRPLGIAGAGMRDVLVEAAVGGRSAATAVQSHPALLGPVLGRLAGWLRRWHESTRADRPLSRAELEDALLRPAAVLGVADGYRRRLEGLCRQAEGTSLPRVAAHNDLTLWNVLLQEHGGLGVLDWEGAEADGLPLVDLYYAATDAVDAAGGYRDRVAAFGSCFAPEGAQAASVRALTAEARTALGLTAEQAELCFHACWLRHATDERRLDVPSDRLPFVQIVERLARGGDALLA